MILFLDHDRSSRDRFVVCLRNRITEDALLRKAKVKRGSYAGEIVSNLYDHLFRRSLDLKRDYTTYFRLEYPNFETYLRKRFRWNANTVDVVAREYVQCEHVIYFQASVSFLDETYGCAFLERLLER